MVPNKGIQPNQNDGTRVLAADDAHDPAEDEAMEQVPADSGYRYGHLGLQLSKRLPRNAIREQAL